eukprot:s202_g22.t1
MPMELTEAQQNELLSAEAQAAMMRGMMANPLGLTAAMAGQPAMETEPKELKRGDREEAREPERRQGKGPKVPRGDQKGGRWGSSSGWDNWSWPKKAHQEQEGEMSDEMIEMCLAMAKLMLRHEDQLNISRTETGFVLFCQTKGDLSMVPDMYRTTTLWQRTKETSPQELTISVRAMLMQRFMEVWLNRLEACTQTADSKAQAEQLLILNAEGKVPYLQYNRTTKTMEVKMDREPLELDEVKKMIKEVGRLALLPLTLLRFHPMRKLTDETLAGDVLPMALQVGLRTAEADQCWRHLNTLSHSGACRAAAMNMRGERMGRSVLADLIQEMINKRCEP